LALDWRDVWEHAIADCQVAVVLRLALDDGSASVISAAAEALAKLVGPTHLGPAQACPTPSGLQWQPIPYLHIKYLHINSISVSAPEDDRIWQFALAQGLW
jgi:hypothetical protein